MTHSHSAYGSDSSHLDDISPPQKFQRFHSDKPIIGLTGGIGSGKTAVSEWFAEQGIDIVDADIVGHQIMHKGSPTLQKLAEALGDWVIDESGEMNRRAVREHVFANDEDLLTLESITHPAIRQEIKKQLSEAKSPYVILSAPLLLEGNEAGLVSLCDRVLVVDADEATQIERASRRDTQSVEKIKAIMANQLSRQDRVDQADDVVSNNGDLQALYEQLKPLHDNYLVLKKI
ncbi:dephospho-CoA kinase [Psychrobacter sp. FDAARGOS_221]|uniref:dephospho-CoA kinase n=1 Tax=Psychrobacter sp. FDAARGOS_221 TaxID=1975705 RepID=UPI000BB5649C|nr:dephospho-CoA kinase [Psychrobacter sp. FDAARGOS_221]PNK60592.1 dephospho-CoA kinase [Psychrobacter sp. FDAARGOS_221]